MADGYSSEARAHSRGRVFLSSYLWKHFCPQSFSGELSGEDTTAHQPTAFILSGWEIVNQYFSQSKNLHDYLLIGCFYRPPVFGRARLEEAPELRDREAVGAPRS